MTAADTHRQIPRRAHRGPTPLSFPQERLFLLDRITPGLGAYNVPTLVRTGALLDDERLRAAFETVIVRHEILRTRLTLADDTPVQEVFDPPRFELTVADLRSLPGAEARDRADELIGGLAGRPFDLSGDVLLRAALVHLADGDLLLVVFHHMGSDHVSSGLLFAELDAIYRALGDGSTPELPELPIQYADFAAWQRAQMDGPFLDELIEYWREELRGAPERLDLPSDRPRPSAQSYRGAWKQLTLPAELVAPLRELARSRGASLFMVLLAAFATVLHRRSGAEDLVVGTPVSGRHHDETASLLGFFSNTLALRCDLSGDPSFDELVERVKLTTLGALAYQELPFEKLVEVLNPARARSHSPLFQVLFGYDIAAAQPATLDGHPLEPLPVPGWQWSRFDLSMIVRDTPEGALHAHVGYASDLFDAATIDRFVGHLETVLAAAGADPQARISAIPILSADERRELLTERNRTEQAYERRPLHDLFCEQAARTPDAVAVACGTDRMTFAELDRASNRLARELDELGSRPGSLVGVCLERSVGLVCALLGVLKTGAAYVPIEPTYPPQRQRFMLTDAGAELLVTQDGLGAVIDADVRAVLHVDRDTSRIAARSDAPLPRREERSNPEALAYVIYTSGSTGVPKGVEIRHRSVANLIAHMRRAPGIGPGDVLANLTTPAFDLSVPDWYLPLTTGARLEIVPGEATLDGVALADWLARTGATFVQATPTTWQLLVDAGWKGSPSLKIVCGGEALPRALADELLTRGSLWHMYGPTETTVWSSILALGPGDGPLPLGGPISNTRFYVLDASRQPVPIGVPGELHIGGEGVARGYHARAELTDEKFVDDPFGGPGRLYRTGDLLRWREDGTLEFHGRIDQQVKLRGFRIELGEIEAVLDGHPAVAGSVAVVREDAPGDQRLVAYVVAAGAEAPGVDELIRLLRSRLPPFMVPSAFVTLDAFPVTVNGKLDRASLPPPTGTRPELARSYAAPETPVQESLAAIIGDVLGLDRVGIDDDFFALGGHSLLAMKVLARIEAEIGLDLNIGLMFDHPTIRELSASLTAGLLAAHEDDELAALLTDIEGAER
jgi:amino acid adenylation domain-containing protein